MSKNQYNKQFYATINDHLRKACSWTSIFWNVQSFVICPKFCPGIKNIYCDTRSDQNGLETLPNIWGTFPLHNDDILKSLPALEAE